MRRSLKQITILLLVMVLSFPYAPEILAQEGETGQPPQNSSLQGRVFNSDRVTPLVGAIVRAVLGDGVQVYSSLPTDERGNYKLMNLAAGDYDFVIETLDGVYLVERTMTIEPGKSIRLSLAAVPAQNVAKRVAAVDKPVLGYAWTLESDEAGGTGFWRSPGGLIIVTLGAFLVALGLQQDENIRATNSTP